MPSIGGVETLNLNKKEWVAPVPRERLCCCIPDQSRLDLRCQNKAEYEVWTDDSPDGYTDCCKEHLEKMLDDHNHFEIFRIGDA